MADKKEPEVQENKLSRRNFLKNAGLTVGGLAVGTGIGSMLIGKDETKKEIVHTEKHGVENHNDAWLFFTRKEDFDTLSAAAEVIFPEDDLGAGAIKLGAPYYIDKQLAGTWGSNADDYMKTPYKNGQTPLTRADIMLTGVRKLNEVSQDTYKKNFNGIKEEEQIELLTKFQNSEIEMKYVASASFFALLRQLTIEGCYSDPVYGGNKNMEGWKMKEFPGAQMSYANVVESKEFVKIEPISMSQHKH